VFSLLNPKLPNHRVVGSLIAAADFALNVSPIGAYLQDVRLTQPILRMRRGL
jgi:hypothetical protein